MQVTICLTVDVASGQLCQWDDPTVGLPAESLLVAVTPGSHRRVTTGSCHVILQLAPLQCESQWVDQRLVEVQ
jgi:hypothetical protein